MTVDVSAALFTIEETFGEVTPTTVRQFDGLSLRYVEEEFGSLNNAVREAWGVSSTDFRDRLVETIRLVYYHRGERPTRDEFVSLTRYTEEQTRAEFPDWEQAMGEIDDPLTDAGYEPVTSAPDDAPTWVQRTIELYGPNWLDRAEQVRDRDDNQCRICEEESDGKALHVHHIVPRSEFVEDERFDYLSANQPENLITLCPQCHVRLEGEFTDVDGPDEFAHLGRQYMAYEEP